MCELLSGPPSYTLDRGIVHRTDELGEVAMLLSDFVAATAEANRLARKWVTEANQPSRVRRLKAVEAGEAGH